MCPTTRMRVSFKRSSRPGSCRARAISGACFSADGQFLFVNIFGSEEADSGGTVAITNEDDTPLAAAAELSLRCHAGRELAVPATKTYVADLAVLAALVGAPRVRDASAPVHTVSACDGELTREDPRLEADAHGAIAAERIGEICLERLGRESLYEPGERD